MIPNGVTSIGEYSFRECISLTTVTIPGSIASIGEYAFTNCACLNTVYYNASDLDINAQYWPLSGNILFIDANGGYVTGDSMDPLP